MTLGPLITVCILTRNRPAMLREAVRSVLEQDYRPLEIVVGDDSDEAGTNAFLQDLELPEGTSLRHLRNAPPLGQAGNVNRLFDEARGPRLILLHDDDLLNPGAIAALDEGWRSHPGVAAVYGRQELIDEAGTVLAEESLELNRRYGRGEQDAGLQALASLCAIRQQFPNDGFLIETALARQVRCRGRDAVGRSTDVDFGIRYGFAAGERPFLLLPGATARYRLSARSLSRGPTLSQGNHLRYEAFKRLTVPEEASGEFNLMMRRLARSALWDYALCGDRRKAIGLYFSKEYRLGRLTPSGLLDLAGAVLPALFRWRQG